MRNEDGGGGRTRDEVLDGLLGGPWYQKGCLSEQDAWFASCSSTADDESGMEKQIQMCLVVKRQDAECQSRALFLSY